MNLRLQSCLKPVHSSLFDSSHFSHSDCGSLPVKTYVNKRTLLEDNSGAQWTRTINLWITDVPLSKLSYVGRYVEWDFNFY